MTATALPLARRRPLPLSLAIPGGVVATWALAVTVLGLWDDAVDGLVAAVTMVFGSLVAGATPQGGGAVAFPVFTKVLGIPAPAARTFALSIQAVGMGTAAAVILARRLPVAWRAIRVVVPTAALAFLAVVTWAARAGDPFRGTPLDDDLVKVAFTVVVAAMAVLMARLRSARLIEADVPSATGPTTIALVLVGLAGGVLSALVGSGADVVVFLALTLGFGVRPGVAVPSSVVVMGMLSVLGLVSLGLVDGQLLAGQVEGVDLGTYWLAAVPVVAIGAPVGSWLASRASDRALLGVVITLATAEVLSTLLFLDRLRTDPVLLGGAALGTAALVQAAWWLHRRQVAATEGNGHTVTTDPPIPTEPDPRVAPVAAGASLVGAGTPLAREPVPVVGVTSPAGHVNHPAARYCHRTGVRLDHSRAPLTTGPRPALGVLTLDDGTAHLLTADLVVGRAPAGHHLVTDGLAEPLQLDDPGRSLSRAHLLVTLRGWAICVADLGSHNGTVRLDDGTALTTGEAVDLGSGGRLGCGSRSLRIDHLHVGPPLPVGRPLR